MELTDTDLRVLDGEEGEARRLAMEILVALGKWSDAERLIPVKTSQVAGVSFRTGDIGLVTFLRDMVAGGAKVTIPTYLNPSGMDNEDWEAMGIDPDFAQVQKEIINMYGRMGINVTCTCAGYDVGNTGNKGDHMAWSESSMVAFGNSYLGVRTNREGGPSALASAIIGMTPEYGLHLAERRIPTVKVEVDVDLKSPSDWGVLGRWYSTKYVKGEIPAFFGLDDIARKVGSDVKIEVKQLCAALGTGKTPMFHADGLTPEQELIPQDFAMEDIFDAEAMESVLAKFRPAEDHVDIAVFGCPHAGLPELQQLADLLNGRKVNQRSMIWIFTGRQNREVLERTGIRATIEKAGGNVYYDTCPVVAPIQGRFPVIATNSAKAAKYLVTMAQAEVLLQPMEDCVDSVTEVVS